MATHSSILAWRIHRQRSLMGYNPWDHRGSDTAEATEHAHGILNSQERVHLTAGSLSSSTNIPSSPPVLSNHHSLISFSSFFRFCIFLRIYSICLSLSDLSRQDLLPLDWLQQFQNPGVQHVILLHSFKHKSRGFKSSYLLAGDH